MSKPPLDARGRSDAADWFGVLPYHWSALAIKRITPVKRGASPRPIDNPIYFDENGEYGWVRISDVTKSGAYLAETEQRLSDLGASLSVKLTPGSLFLSIAGSVGKACIANAKVCIHDGFVYFPNLRVNPRWLFQIFESSLPFAGLGKLGTQLNLNTDTVASIKIPIPPSSEIEHILGFLDTETAKIDHLIQKQERLIELLQEKRQAVISHAVTKGLDPTAPMKDSGIEWLGEVPAHWNVCSLGKVASVTTGSTPDRSKPEFWNGDIPWVKTGEINYSPICSSEESITALGFSSSATKLAEPGTMLMAMYGQGITRGRVAILHIPAAYNQACAAIKPKSQVAVEFLRYFFIAAYDYVRDDGNETSQMNLSSTYISKIKVALPEVIEQHKIVSRLDSQVGKIDQLIAKANQSIELMKERRSALISAAVTGKIDVREAA